MAKSKHIVVTGILRAGSLRKGAPYSSAALDMISKVSVEVKGSRRDVEVETTIYPRFKTDNLSQFAQLTAVAEELKGKPVELHIEKGEQWVRRDGEIQDNLNVVIPADSGFWGAVKEVGAITELSPTTITQIGEHNLR